MIKKPDLSAALSGVSPKVRRALVASHEALSKAGVPHALVGGIAVGAYGYVRATKDVDWLVGSEAFRFVGRLVTMREGIPFEYDGVRIDYLSPAAAGEAAAMTASKDALAVSPVEHIIRQKLKAGRARDQGDIVELLKRGVDGKAVRKYIESAAPQLLLAFDTLAARAASEDE
jgi:hypothetical protein